MIVLSKLLPVFFLYPLGIVLVLLAVSLVLLKKQKIRAVFALVGTGVGLLLLLSNEIVANALMGGLERRYLPVDVHSVKADAIVALGGCGRPKMYPRSHVEFNEAGERMFHSLRLYKAGAAPWVIVSGGGIDFILKGQADARDMRELMVEFGMPFDSILVEDKSRNTYENAVLVKKLMEDKGIRLKIILVTSAAHMPRSVAIFKKAGFEVVPAPTDFLVEKKSYNWYSILPRVENIYDSTHALKERIGFLFYHLMGWL